MRAIVPTACGLFSPGGASTTYLISEGVAGRQVHKPRPARARMPRDAGYI